MDSPDYNLISSDELEGVELVYYEGFSESVDPSTFDIDIDLEHESSKSTSHVDNVDDYYVDKPASSSDFSLSLYEYEEDVSNDEDDENSDLLVSQSSSSSVQNNFEILNIDSAPSSQSIVQIEVEEQDDEEEEVCNVVRKSRKRKRKAKPEEWFRNVNKKKRSLGQEYEKKITTTTDQGLSLQSVAVPARQFGPRCKSKRCKKIKKCNQLTEPERKKIFDRFWGMTWNQKQLFVTSNVNTTDPHTRAPTRSFNRDNSMIYYLMINNARQRVCREMFLSTLGIKRTQVYNWLNKNNNNNNNSSTPKPKPTTSNNNNSQLVLRRDFLNTFFNRLPKCPSHYCRRSSTKIYLEPIVKSLRKLKKLYNEECNKNNVKPFSRVKFERIFHEFNLSLFKSKKDLCNICIQHELHHISDEIYNNHQIRKNEARCEKKLDKNLAKAGNCYTLAMDLQQVKLCPLVQANASFFKQKLGCHNFTIYNLSTSHACCYWWNEIDADSTASPFASCIVDYLNNNCLDLPLPINIYSDGCGYQNRNSSLSSALLSFSTANNITVTQKFLEKGHTQMEVDSVHSTIESKLKNENIYIPSDYSKISIEARSTGNPYEVKELTFNFFSDYSDKTQMVYPSIRPGQQKVIDIRNLQYNPDGKILYKLNYSDEFRELPKQTNRVPPLQFPQLYHEPLKITDDKFSDLQDLKSVIPTEFHSFYDSLIHGKVKKKNK